MIITFTGFFFSAVLPLWGIHPENSYCICAFNTMTADYIQRIREQESHNQVPGKQCTDTTVFLDLDSPAGSHVKNKMHWSWRCRHPRHAQILYLCSVWVVPIDKQRIVWVSGWRIDPNNYSIPLDSPVGFISCSTF